MTSETNNSLFDAEVKQNFLEDMIAGGAITEETAKNYERILGITAEYEGLLEKDLNKFNLKELEAVLLGFKANNRNTVETYARIISSYLNWSVDNNSSEVNPLAELKPNDFIKYLTNGEIYYTERQLRRWEGRMENYQDAIITRLLFLGVGGKQMSEIRNLKKGDVDRDNKRLRLVNTLKEDKVTGLPIKFTERWLEIDDEYTFDLIEGAMNQKTYTKRNGNMKQNPHVRPYTDLVANEYVVRSSITKTENFNYPVDKFVVYRRIQMIAEVFGIENFSAKLIQRSGMIHLGNKLMQDGELSLDDMKMVADRFNIKSYHNLKGFLTVENILKTYPQQ
jgi:integrase